MKIDKDIPIPPKGNGGRPPKWPLSELEVGDSFLADTPTIRKSIEWHQKRYGTKFCTRKTGEGWRVWRTE